MALANQKGGVGKTASTVNLAYALAQRGKSVLAIDLDPQASLTIALGQDPRTLDQQHKIINYGLLDNVPLKDMILEGMPALIPASITLAKAEVSLVPRWNSVNVLKGKLRNYLKTMNKRVCDTKVRHKQTGEVPGSLPNPGIQGHHTYLL